MDRTVTDDDESKLISKLIVSPSDSSLIGTCATSTSTIRISSLYAARALLCSHGDPPKKDADVIARCQVGEGHIAEGLSNFIQECRDFHTETDLIVPGLEPRDALGRSLAHQRPRGNLVTLAMMEKYEEKWASEYEQKGGKDWNRARPRVSLCTTTELRKVKILSK